jgi:uncharacterized small protein (DUF1192 family)
MAFDPFLEEKPLLRPAGHELGQDLSTLSVSELDERIDLLAREIERMKKARADKEATRNAASAFFKS